MTTQWKTESKENERKEKKNDKKKKSPPAPSADALSGQSTPTLSRVTSRTFTTSSSRVASCATAEGQGQIEESLPRRTMINGVLTLDRRFDRSGCSIKDRKGKCIQKSPFNSITTLRRSTPQKAEMLEVIRLCADLQGGGDRLPAVAPEYFSQPLSPTSRFEAPVRIPDKRTPLGI